MSEKSPDIGPASLENDTVLHVREFVKEDEMDFAIVVWQGIHFKVNGIGEVLGASDEAGEMVVLHRDARWNQLTNEEQADLEQSIGRTGEDALTTRTIAKMADILQRWEANLDSKKRE